MSSLSIVDDNISDIKALVDVVDQIDELSLNTRHTDICSFFTHYKGETGPDFLLLDIYLKDDNGIEHIQEIKKRYPNTEIIIYSFSQSYDDLYNAIINGASGYIFKTLNGAELERSLRTMAEGGAIISPLLAAKILENMRSNFFDFKKSNKLSEREIETLSYLAQGWTYTKIAEKQNLKMNGLKTRISRIYKKLHVTNKMAAVLKYKAMRRG